MIVKVTFSHQCLSYYQGGPATHFVKEFVKKEALSFPQVTSGGQDRIEEPGAVVHERAERWEEEDRLEKTLEDFQRLWLGDGWWKKPLGFRVHQGVGRDKVGDALEMVEEGH